MVIRSICGAQYAQAECVSNFFLVPLRILFSSCVRLHPSLCFMGLTCRAKNGRREMPFGRAESWGSIPASPCYR